MEYAVQPSCVAGYTIEVYIKMEVHCLMLTQCNPLMTYSWK